MFSGNLIYALSKIAEFYNCEVGQIEYTITGQMTDDTSQTEVTMFNAVALDMSKKDEHGSEEIFQESKFLIVCGFTGTSHYVEHVIPIIVDDETCKEHVIPIWSKENYKMSNDV